MSRNFSSALKFTDLNDYITPSQQCIKPVVVEKSDQTESVKIHVQNDGTYVEEAEDGTYRQLKPTKISLTDCLACSGCVTTAETVLIEAQSTIEFLNKIENRPENSLLVVTTSPQTVASIAASTGYTMREVYLKLNALFTVHLKADYFFDSNFSRDIALMEQAKEFVERYKKKENLPMIASSCPGWICYAEKTLGDLALPYISSTKSPQQIMGTLVKSFLPQHIKSVHNVDVLPSDIYHVALMPCFDKKLESLRSDFYDKVYDTNDVDLVLTSVELPDLLEKLNLNFDNLELVPVKSFLNSATEDGIMRGQKGVSGGFAEYVFKYAAKELFNEEVHEIEMTTLRNKDLKEFKLTVNGEDVLIFSTAYGFRNIQNIVRQLRTNRCKYHYVEIMACPSGCINGGGQIPPTLPMTPQKLLAAVSETYQDQIERQPEENQLVLKIYKEWVRSEPFTEATQKLFHTQYRPVPKMEEKNPLTIQW